MNLYDELGVKRVVNASATLTRLGGSRMPPPVLDAMRAAAGSFVDYDELARRVGARLASLTHNDACYVSCGAAAGIALAVAACVAGDDPAKVARFPHLDGLKDEVVVHRGQRNGYDYAARQTGVRLVEIGTARATFAWELDAAITERTACVLYFAGAHFAEGALPLPDVIAAAHARGVPVVVDAAAQIPPVSNLWHFTRDLGADLAVFSGGKGLRGPQSSGLVLGRADLVAACRVNGSPNSAIGRPMKVGKEELAGLLAAVEWSLAQDEAAIFAGYEATVQGWLRACADLPGVRAERGYPSEAGQPHSRAIVHILPESGTTRDALVAALWEGNPAVAVSPVGGDAVALNPQCLEAGEAEIVTERLRVALRVPVVAAVRGT